MIVGGAALALIAVGGEHVGQHGLAVDGLVQGLRRSRSVGVFSGILFVSLRLALRALGRALPVAAELVFDQVKGRQSSLAGVRIEFDDLLQLVFIDPLAQVGLFFPGRGPCGGVGLLQLPQDVGRAPGSELGNISTRRR